MQQTHMTKKQNYFLSVQEIVPKIALYSSVFAMKSCLYTQNQHFHMNFLVKLWQQIKHYLCVDVSSDDNDARRDFLKKRKFQMWNINFLLSHIPKVWKHYRWS